MYVSIVQMAILENSYIIETGINFLQTPETIDLIYNNEESSNLNKLVFTQSQLTPMR